MMNKRTLLAASAVALAGLSVFAYAGAQQDKDKKADPHGHSTAAPPAVMLPNPGETKRPDGAVLYIISPQDGEEVRSPFAVQFGLKGMGVAPAGIYMGDEMPTGHHHLLVDVEEMPNMKLPLPKDDNHLHFGGGQTETVLNLPPGKHTLQLVLGDHAHIPHGAPLVSEKITVTVKE